MASPLVKLLEARANYRANSEILHRLRASQGYLRRYPGDRIEFWERAVCGALTWLWTAQEDVRKSDRPHD